MKTKTFLVTLGLSLSAAATSLGQLGFLFEPASQSASVGADVLFVGTAFSAEPPSYQWRKDGQPIDGQTFDFLYLFNVQPQDAGGYDVVVSTTSGSITSQVATLTIDAAFSKVVSGPLVTELGNSTGCAWGDLDNDGDLDVVVTRNGNGFNSLFRNEGNGGFTKLDASPVTTDLGTSSGATWADYDNDGWLDLLVLNTGFNATPFLYHNNGDGTFARVSVGLGADLASLQTAAWADYDRDGWLDLFVGPLTAFGAPAGGLYRNVSGLLTRQALTFAGLVAAQSVTWSDYDADGDPDLYVAVTTGGGFPGQPTTANEVLYRNDGGVFTNITNVVAVTSGNASTTASWGDYDGDGQLDVFVGNGEGQVKFLFRNLADGTFAQIGGEIAHEEGANESSAWGDYDNDGWLDLFVANNQGGGNFLFHNHGAGIFSLATLGSVTGDRANSVGGAWVDIENDGDLDLFVANFGENNFLYRNNGNPNAWLVVTCVGRASNRSAVGARVRVLATIGGVERWQVREIAARDNSGSPNALRAEFGLGDATLIKTLRVEWPSSVVTELQDVDPRQFLTLTEPPSIVITGGSTNEGDTGTRDLVFTIRLLAPSAEPVSVDFTTTNGTAVAGTDYIATNGTLVFPAGTTSLPLPVPILGNLVDDTNRSFRVVLSNPVHMPISTAIAVGTILDDDPLTVAVDNVSVTEGNAGTSGVVFTVALNKPWTAPVTLDYGTANSTAVAPQDYLSVGGSLTFNPGEVSVPLTVQAVGDIFNEPNEIFFMNLSNVVGAVFLRRQAAATIVNDDPLPTISFASASQLEGDAGSTQMVLTATLSAPSGRAVSFSYTTTNGTAVVPGDYGFRSGVLNFPAGVTSSNIFVSVTGDAVPEGTETFYLLLSSPNNGVLAGVLAPGVILDNDFRLVMPAAGGNGSSLGFHSVSNRQHRVERTFSLMAPLDWVVVPGAESITGNGGLILVDDPVGAAQPRRFYRVQLLP